MRSIGAGSLLSSAERLTCFDTGQTCSRFSGALGAGGNRRVNLACERCNDLGCAPKLRALAETVLSIFPEMPVWLVIGTMEDKDSAQMVDILRSLHPKRVICTEVSMTHRAVTSADALATHAAKIGLAGEVVRDPLMAVRRAIELAGNDGLVIVTGSLFLGSQVRPMIIS